MVEKGVWGTIVRGARYPVTQVKLGARLYCVDEGQGAVGKLITGSLQERSTTSTTYVDIPEPPTLEYTRAQLIALEAGLPILKDAKWQAASGRGIGDIDVESKVVNTAGVGYLRGWIKKDAAQVKTLDEYLIWYQSNIWRWRPSDPDPNDTGGANWDDVFDYGTLPTDKVSLYMQFKRYTSGTNATYARCYRWKLYGPKFPTDFKVSDLRQIEGKDIAQMLMLRLILPNNTYVKLYPDEDGSEFQVIENTSGAEETLNFAGLNEAIFERIVGSANVSVWIAFR